MSPRYSLQGDKKRSGFGIGRILIEIPIIALGIYLAFALDNWGEQRKRRDLEKKYLTQLLEEAKINQKELNADQDSRNVQLEYIRKLMIANTRPVAADTLRDAINLLMMVRIYSPTDAVYQDLVSSGNLGLIKSDAVKGYLLNYRRQLSRAPITEARDLKIIEDRLEPYFLRKQVLSLLQPFRPVADLRVNDQQKDRIIRALLNDREFIDLVYLRVERIEDVLFFENPMQWLLRDLVLELEKELAKFDD